MSEATGTGDLQLDRINGAGKPAEKHLQDHFQTVRCEEPTVIFKNSEKKVHHLKDIMKEAVLKQQEAECRKTLRWEKQM